MTEICLNLNNFSQFEALMGLFPASNDYEFTAKKVFRSRKRNICCGQQMVHDGYNFVRKKGFGKVKVGKQICKKCGKQHHEDKSFWKKLLGQWCDTINSLILTLRDSHVAWDVISKLMCFFIPMSKGKAMYLFNGVVEQFQYPQSHFAIVCYDEQHPRKGRTQKFRLTLLDYKTRVPIAEELFDNKDDKTIEAFLRKHLDTTKELVVITDCDRRYPSIFKRIWGSKVIHQKCLLHLNKLIVKDFDKCRTILSELNKYKLLNLFYNRDKELKFLERAMRKQERKKFFCDKERKEWTYKTIEKFRDYVRTLENRRRREHKNLTKRPLWKAEQLFNELWQQRQLFSKRIKARLKMIGENWKYFTAFYAVKDCPATNNAIENYYSTSLKTHRKKQLRTDKGILNHMKLSAIKRVQGFCKPNKTLLEIYGLIGLIIT